MMQKSTANNEERFLLAGRDLTDDDRHRAAINMVEAAEKLGVSRADLRMVLQELGLKEDDEPE